MKSKSLSASASGSMLGIFHAAAFISDIWIAASLRGTGALDELASFIRATTYFLNLLEKQLSHTTAPEDPQMVGRMKRKIYSRREYFISAYLHTLHKTASKLLNLVLSRVTKLSSSRKINTGLANSPNFKNQLRSTEKFAVFRALGIIAGTVSGIRMLTVTKPVFSPSAELRGFPAREFLSSAREMGSTIAVTALRCGIIEGASLAIERPVKLRGTKLLTLDKSHMLPIIREIISASAMLLLHAAQIKNVDTSKLWQRFYQSIAISGGGR